MLELVAMTENWSRPWHSLQRSLAGKLPLRSAAADRADGKIPIQSWLHRARGEFGPAPALDRQ